MKQVKAMLLAALLSLGIPQVHADTTNVVQNLNVQLWGVQSGGPVTNHNTIITGIARAKIGNRQIIQALGTATSNSFVLRARLVIVTPVGGGDSAIQVRDGTLTVDVTGFFAHQQLGGAVSGSSSNTVNQRVVNLDFSIQRFVLHDAAGFPALGLHFDVNGFASESTPPNHGGVGNLQIDAAGAGDVGGSPAVLRGEVEVHGDRLEVVPGVIGATS